MAHQAPASLASVEILSSLREGSLHVHVHVHVTVEITVNDGEAGLCYPGGSVHDVEGLLDAIHHLKDLVRSTSIPIASYEETRVLDSERRPHNVIWLRPDVAFDSCCGKLLFYDELQHLVRSHDLMLHHRDGRLAETLNFLLTRARVPQSAVEIAERLMRMNALPEYDTMERATHAVAKAISDLRILLGDFDHTLIRTVRGRGVAIYPEEVKSPGRRDNPPTE